MSTIFKNRQLKLRTKIWLLECFVWPVLLYGCDAWIINKNMRERIDAVEIWFLRRILRISWVDKVTNEEVLKKAGVKRSLIKVIRKRRMQFLGHVMRSKEMEHQVYDG